MHLIETTTQTLISITIKICIELSALSLPICHSITFYVFLQIQRNVQWYLNVLLTIGFLCYANHSLDGPMDACWSENANYCVLQNSARFSNAELTISVNP